MDSGTCTSSDSSDSSDSNGPSDDGSMDEPAFKRFKLNRGVSVSGGLGMGRVVASLEFLW